jgi:UDP-GlcNAc:undecaprenyl-phosphate GlcNAc-1-phosphate transferase
MTPAFAAFAAALLAGLLLTPLARRLALRLGVVDLPTQTRKVHQGAMPRLGGLAVFFAFLVGLTLALLHPSGRPILIGEGPRLGGFLLATLAITALGAWDDARGLKYRKKFLGEFAVASLLYWFGYRVEILALPWLGEIRLGLLSFPLTVLWLVGVTNAVNLIDGLDGLAAGVSLFALATVFWSASLDGVVVVLPIAAALAGATLGFLPYNVHRARIFLGDCGALLLGTALGALSIRAYSKGPSTIALLAPIVMLGLPITDTLLAMLRRYLAGRSPFEADREHLHHRLLALGLSQRVAVAALYGVAVTFSGLALALRGHSPARAALGIALGVALVVALLRALRYREVLHLGEALRAVRQARHHARNRLLWLKDERRAWRGAADAEALWERLAQTPDALGVTSIELRVGKRSFRLGPRLPVERSIQERFNLDRGGARLGELIIMVGGHRTALVADERLVYEYLADFVADSLEEIMRRGGALAPAETLLAPPPEEVVDDPARSTAANPVALAGARARGATIVGVGINDPTRTVA